MRTSRSIALGLSILFLFALAIGIAGLIYIGILPDPTAIGQRGVRLNIEYIQTKLGRVVLDYKDSQGRLPDTFDAAFSHGTQRLPHRGDYFGRGISYHKRDAESFFFVSTGADGKYEAGRGDDLVVCWENGRWFVGDSQYVEDFEAKRLEEILSGVESEGEPD